MAKLCLPKGTTSKIVHVVIGNSSVTTGAGLTGLAFNTAGLVAWYIRPGDTALTSITLVNETVGTWVSGGFKEVDATNSPGLIELGIPNACLTSGANQVTIYLFGAANMRQTTLEIELTSTSNQDSIRGGMTALPNAAAGAAGGLWILGANNTAAITIGALTAGNIITGSISATTLSTSGTTTLNALTVTNNFNVGGNHTITGTTTHTGNVTLTGNLGIGGTTTLTGKVQFSGDWEVAGTINFDGTENHLGVVNYNGGFNVQNAVFSATAGQSAISLQGFDAPALFIQGGTAEAAVKITAGTGQYDILCAGDTGNFVLSATTFTGRVNMLAGFSVTQSVANQPAILAVGNGTEAGIQATGGATSGCGILAEGGTPNGAGFIFEGSGSGGDISLSGDGRLHGLLNAVTLVNGLAANTVNASALATDAVTEITTPVLAKLPAALVSGRIDASVGAYQSGQAPLQPTVAGRTLDVSATGEGGLDWGNVGQQSATVNLSNTELHLVDLVTTVTNNPNAGNGAYLATATVTDGTNPLQQVTVRVTSGINTFSTVTDASGHATFALDAGSYTVSATKAGYTMAPSVRTVTGNQTGTLVSSNIVLTAVVIPVQPTDPTLCRVYGYMRNTRTNTLLANTVVTATLRPGSVSRASTAFLVGREMSTKTDTNGLFQLDLIRNDGIVPTGTTWEIFCKEAGIKKEVTCAAATLDFSTQLP